MKRRCDEALSSQIQLGGASGDCSGGVIAALIALPYGLAMASLMGLPPVLGVFTSILTAPMTRCWAAIRS